MRYNFSTQASALSQAPDLPHPPPAPAAHRASPQHLFFRFGASHRNWPLPHCSLTNWMHSALWKHSIQESILQLGWPAPNTPSPTDLSQAYLNSPELSFSKMNKMSKKKKKSRKVFSDKVCLSQFWHNNLCCVKFIYVCTELKPEASPELHSQLKSAISK